MERIDSPRLRRLIESLPALVFVVDRGRILEIVSRDERTPFSGEPGTTFLLRAWEDPVAGRLEGLLDRAFAGEEVHDTFPWREGWWDLWLSPSGDDGSAPTEVLGLVLDVSATHRSRELEARLAALVESAQVAIVTTDPDVVVTHWNRGAQQLFGWTREEALGRHLAELIDTREPGEMTVGERAAELDAGEALRRPYIETLRRHRDGRELLVGQSLSAIRGADGEVLGASIIYQDLSARDQAVGQLARSEERFRVLAESVQDVIYRVGNHDGVPRLEYLSPASAAVLGFTNDRILGQPWLLRERAHPDDADHVMRTEEDMRRIGSGLLRSRWCRADGRWIVLEDRRTLLEVDGRPDAVIGIVRDVTASHEAAERTREELDSQRQVAEELRDLDEMRTAFLSAVSHELRTPLTGVLGFAETAALLAERSDDVRLESYLQRLLANARRLEELMDDLLDVDRLSRGRVTPQREQVDLAQLVAAAVERLDSIGHHVVTDLQTVTLELDPVMIERVVENLLRNAERHTPAGTTVWVRVAATSAGAVLVVEDDGPGISETDLGRVFEPFQQGRAAQRLPSPGTGIGLSLVRRFVEVHGGSVEVADRAGGGARFEVRLPAAAPEPATP